MHQKLLIVIIGLVILGAGMTIGQVWGPLMDWALYTKAIITIVILIIVIGLVMVIKTDLGHHKKLKDDNYLD